MTRMATMNARQLLRATVILMTICKSISSLEEKQQSSYDETVVRSRDIRDEASRRRTTSVNNNIPNKNDISDNHHRNGNLIDNKEKSRIGSFPTHIQKLSPYIDWELLRDKYIISTFSSDEKSKSISNNKSTLSSRDRISSTITAKRKTSSKRRRRRRRLSQVKKEDNKRHEWWEVPIHNVTELEAKTEQLNSRTFNRGKEKSDSTDNDSSNRNNNDGDDEQSNETTALKPVHLEENEKSDHLWVETKSIDNSRNETFRITDGNETTSRDGNDSSDDGNGNFLLDHLLAGNGGNDGTKVIGDDGNNNNNGNPSRDDGVGGVIIPDYKYNLGNCPEPGSTGLICAPPDLHDICDKHNKSVGSFRSCLLACVPSFCCIHDAPESTNPFAPNCNEDENCAQYAPCYIVWWSLHNTVGPATEFRLTETNTDDFYDVESDEVTDTIGDADFFQQLLFHHFDDITPILELIGQAESIPEVFANPEIWDADSVISGNPPPP